MTEHDILFFGLLGTVISGAALLAWWRLRRWAAARAEAEQRSALAMEEMQRLAARLRDKGRE